MDDDSDERPNGHEYQPDQLELRAMMRTSMSSASAPSPATGRDRRRFSRGQIAIIFAGSILTFVALCAVVVDVSWYWANTLRVQRAADAAALAGAVYLPNDKGTAFAEARAAAKRNGYADGVDGITVTPTVDDNDPRQLDVQIDGTVSAFFAHALGINGWGVTRVGEGVFIQPVEMGSPLAYYGVGDFYTNVVTMDTVRYSSVANPPYQSSAAANWTNPDNAWSTTNAYTTEDTDGQIQGWQDLHIPAIQGQVLDGMILSFQAKVSTASTACRVRAEVSWDAGANWNDANPKLATTTLTTDDVGYTIGQATSFADWGGHAWDAGDLANNNFRVRLTYLKGAGCGDLSLNTLSLTAYSHTDTTTTTLTKSDVKDPNGTILPSHGAWGAVITRGGNKENGDAYSPANDGGANAQYDPNGYDYVVSLPAGGTINVFDPGFCAMGQVNAGSIGTGDHWIGTSGTPVSTYYTLWNTNGKPGLRTTWTKLYSSNGLFENQKGYDPGNVSPKGPPNNATDSCDVYHDKWWQFPAGNLVAGQYAVTVQTTDPDDAGQNAGTNAENMWALEALGGGTPQIFGNGRMAVYNNLRSGASSQTFYLALIDKATGAGKTALIDIFDPGDVAGDATLRILNPGGAGGSQVATTFSYTTDGNCKPGVSDACSGTGVPSLKTATGGKSSFNDTWIHISIPLPSTYGSSGLWEGGWWQIQYQTPDGGNDTTTWQVSIQGNPVHLIVP
jgi:Flp pilus assembly protein TadG